jgi:hypothetical protein
MTLAAMAGADVDRNAIERAVGLDIAVEASCRDLVGARRAAGAPARITGAPSLRTLRELRLAATRLERELANAQAKLAWYDEMLTSRDRALWQARRQLATVHTSVSFRLGRVLITPARFAKRAGRALARRARRGP